MSTNIENMTFSQAKKYYDSLLDTNYGNENDQMIALEIHWEKEGKLKDLMKILPRHGLQLNPRPFESYKGSSKNLKYYMHLDSINYNKTGQIVEQNSELDAIEDEFIAENYEALRQ